jgi:hypothetical protein
MKSQATNLFASSSDDVVDSIVAQDTQNDHHPGSTAMRGLCFTRFERLAMLLPNLRADPHNNRGVQASRVRQQLAEMTMVSRLQLIFYNDGTITPRVAGMDVAGKISNGLFKLYQLEIDAKCLAK